MLTELAWATIKGSDGSVYESRSVGGAVSCTRVSTGRYTLTLSGTAFKVLSLSQQTPGDISTTTPADWSVTVANGVSADVQLFNLSGTPFDLDFAVRFLG